MEKWSSPLLSPFFARFHLALTDRQTDWNSDRQPLLEANQLSAEDISAAAAEVGDDLFG